MHKFLQALQVPILDYCFHNNKININNNNIIIIIYYYCVLHIVTLCCTLERINVNDNDACMQVKKKIDYLVYS